MNYAGCLLRGLLYITSDPNCGGPALCFRPQVTRVDMKLSELKRDCVCHPLHVFIFQVEETQMNFFLWQDFQGLKHGVLLWWLCRHHFGDWWWHENYWKWKSQAGKLFSLDSLMSENDRALKVSSRNTGTLHLMLKHFWNSPIDPIWLALACMQRISYHPATKGCHKKPRGCQSV